MSKMNQIKIIGISGGSGSGKTTLALSLCHHLGKFSSILYQDSYYIDQSHRFDGDGGSVNFDHPESLEFSLLAQHLDALKTGKSIEVPQYDFATHRRLKETSKFNSVKYIIVDGTLLLSQPLIREKLDLKVYVQTSEQLRFQRRLRRDVAERGRSPEGVEKQFRLQVKPMHDEFVEPSLRYADLLLSGEISIEDCLSKLLKNSILSE
jgi:uridine kinase